MSPKAKQGTANSNVALFQQAQRNLKKRDFKQALKDARVCFRQAPLEPHRVLLEQAAVGRARELDQAGLKPQAQDILQELLTLPVVEPEVRKELPELLSHLGMLDRYPEYRQRLEADPELQARLVTRAADLAVLNLNNAKTAAPEIRHGAALVIAALDKLDAGQDTDALELLKDISRQSPFADWRLFVRGLIAYYRKDQETAQANWSRLDAERIPGRLTQLLNAIRQTDLELTPSDPNLANTIGALEAALWGAPLLSDLRHLKARAAAGEWIKAAGILRNMRDTLRVVDPGALEGITAYLRNQAIRTADRELLKELTHCTDALPWDPRWNQARAQMLELDQDAPSNETVKAWIKYLEDLDQVTCWTPDEITLAKALIHGRLGKTYTLQLDAPTDPNNIPPLKALEPDDLAAYMECDWDFEFGRPPNEFFEWQAHLAFEQSLALKPDLLETYVAYGSLWEKSRRPELALQVCMKLLAQFPEHTDSLEKIVMYYETRDQLELAEPYMQRLMQAKPLDEEYRKRTWSLEIGLTRHCCLRQDWAAARSHLEAAKAFNVGPSEQFRWHLVDAILCQFAAESDKYQAALEQALQIAGHSAPVWFFMTVQAAAYNLPTSLFRQYEKLWLQALELPFDPHAAGLMAEQATIEVDKPSRYSGKVKHLQALADYLKQGTKSQFELSHLRDICQFLIDKNSHKILLDQYLLHGRGKFRQSGFFNMCLAMLNFQQGPEECDRNYVKKLLTEAQTRIIASNDLWEKQFLTRIQETLALLEDFEEYDDDFEDVDDPYDEDEFCEHLRREFDRQLKKRVRPGCNVANATQKDLSKIMKPDVIEEIVQSLANSTGLSREDVQYLLHKYGPRE